VPLGLFFLPGREVLWGCGRGAEAPAGGVRPGPWELDLAELGAGRAQALPARGLGAWPQTARGDPSLAPGQAGEGREGRAQPAAEAWADAGPGWPPRQGGGGRGPRGGAEGECHVAQPLVRGGDERPIDCETRGPRGGGPARGTARAGRFGGELCAHGRQGSRAVGMWPVGQARGALGGQRQTAAQPGAGGTPLGGRDRGGRAHPAAPPSLVHRACRLWPARHGGPA